ncbi:MAG: carbon-nitrogen hydrolase [Parachlamydiales bacterium]|nr:carbon-nitrogen hydrolase [Parachlamydiales bacterium]
MKIALIQTDADEEKEKNLQKHINLIEKAAKSGAQIVCLQELFLTKYFCQKEDSKYFELAENFPNETTELLSSLAKKNNIVLISSLFEKRAQGLFHNTTICFDADGKILGKYRKMHIPDDPGFYEKFYFTPGDLGFKVFNTKFAKIGVLICWDQWYPEAARLTAMKGAEIIFYPTAIGWGSSEEENTKRQQKEAWKTMHRSHSIANGVFVAAANRIGTEDNIKFWGTSIVYDPFGDLLKEGSSDKEEVLITECDLSKIDTMRQGWPFFRDRRIDAYETLLKRFDTE